MNLWKKEIYMTDYLRYYAYCTKHVLDYTVLVEAAPSFNMEAKIEHLKGCVQGFSLATCSCATSYAWRREDVCVLYY